MIALLIVYLLGFLITLYLSPRIVPENESTGEPIMAVTHLMIAVGWPVLLCYLAAAYFSGDNDG